MSTEPAQRWSLTRQALERLLGRLSDGGEAAAHEYEYIRRRLVAFFELRGIPASESLADEALDRVAHKLEQGEAIQHLRAYFSGVAQRMALEWERERARERAAAVEAWSMPAALEDGMEEGPESQEQRAACLRRCLRALPRASRELIVHYYREGGSFDLEGRRALADRLGITYTSLKARAHRIRGRVEECLRECLRARSQG